MTDSADNSQNFVMASLAESIHSPHAMLVSNERQGVNSMLLALKGIETRLRQNGHTTTFSEDGIYLTYGEANVNCESTLEVEQRVKAFEKRMNDEIKDDAKKTTAKKPRVRACTPIPSPSDWQESNISRHAADGLGWDMKTAAKRQRATSLFQFPAGGERVNDKQDVAFIPVSPDAPNLAIDGNTPDLVHEQIGEDKHEVAPLPLPPDVSRTADAMDEPETASPPQKKARVKLPAPAGDTLLSEINRTLCQIESEPLAKEIAEVRQEEPREAVTPTYDQMPHVLIQQQQARIQELERELKQANAARLTAENRTRELVEEAYPAVSGHPQERAKMKDQAEEILKLISNDQVMDQHPGRITKAIAELQVVQSRRLQKLDRTTNSIWKTLNNFREGRKVAADDLARMQTTVERHDSEWMPKLADRVNMMETDLKALHCGPLCMITHLVSLHLVAHLHRTATDSQIRRPMATGKRSMAKRVLAMRWPRRFGMAPLSLVKIGALWPSGSEEGANVADMLLARQHHML